ncbi:tRNA (adenosine(37)-N6)-dimethylallyltransferase MiaA [Helicobacter cappadocius]|uniref:tRNA dimethylallyltransferase n=1 Tax=Helicobacter cappadocius TaxID=3063998 RepID=A0AA90PRU9_9HELI|nr:MULTISPECIES: tRNA (adenosine(37)-N6)-dimethylallyltransferase MiaA [unclassified Helicobacter]MDO7252889.1 tRNA (adenosine(37)-N6)-dimethylallyltransferase MiaA [Helicobacter sp. faydin-H75]MDP2538932.1 tRNA (adenosine(37)-N6)-dimethylallyltransferase MiaA [Helicobacter sp. faydin-H76]
MKNINLIAILGPTASGKSALALEIAKAIDAEIFSLDSLSIYREIDIASAKPKKIELEAVKHYGIDELNITEANNAMVFKNLLEDTIKTTQKQTLLIVGGSSFYLKSIIEGLSPIPTISSAQKEEINAHITSIKNPYEFLQQIDLSYANCIKPNDTYRTHKALEIFFNTQIKPSEYFRSHPKIPFPYSIKLYEIEIERETLRARIAQRTDQMITEGIVEEIASLVQKYPKDSQPFKAIGAKECISYLEGHINYAEIAPLISTHTSQLAKRQITFNRTQFKNISQLSSKEIYENILYILK